MNNDQLAPTATVATKLLHVAAAALSAGSLIAIAAALMFAPAIIILAATKTLGVDDATGTTVALVMTIGIWARVVGIHRLLIHLMYKSLNSLMAD